MSYKEQCEYYGMYARMYENNPRPEICGRLDAGAFPDEERFILNAFYDKSIPKHILTQSIFAPDYIRKNQKAILIELVRRGGEYYNGCGWCWDYPSAATKLLESLMKYGVVGYKTRYPRPSVYELTPFGRDYCEAHGLKPLG